MDKEWAINKDEPEVIFTENWRLAYFLVYLLGFGRLKNRMKSRLIYLGF